MRTGARSSGADAARRARVAIGDARLRPLVVRPGEAARVGELQADDQVVVGRWSRCGRRDRAQRGEVGERSLVDRRAGSGWPGRRGGRRRPRRPRSASRRSSRSAPSAGGQVGRAAVGRCRPSPPSAGSRTGCRPSACRPSRRASSTGVAAGPRVDRVVDRRWRRRAPSRWARRSSRRRAAA